MYLRLLPSAFLSALLLVSPADAALSGDWSHALAKAASGSKAKKSGKKSSSRKEEKKEEKKPVAEEQKETPAEGALPLSPDRHPEEYARFVASLDEMLEKNIYDFCPPMAVVLSATGDEMAVPEWMKKAADAGNAVALQYLADRELCDAPADQLQCERLKKAYADLRRAANAGYDPAKVLVSTCLEGGIGVRKDEAAARKYMMEACKTGTFIPRLRWLIMEKRLKSFDDRERPEVKGEVDRGNHYVTYYLARLAIEPAERLEWLRKAAEQGSAEAFFALSVILADSGQLHDSYDLLKKAVALRNPDALFMLGSMLLESSVHTNIKELNIKQDNATALHFIRLASLLNLGDANYVMGRSYYEGTNGVAQDKERAYRQFAEGARQVHLPSLAAQGLMLLRGEGVEQDTRMGLRRITIAANGRHSYAIVLLAYAHYKGLGVPADAGKAAELLQDAATLGYSRAYVDLAYITAKGGPGEKPNERMAQTYLRWAAVDMKEKAQEYYDKLEKAGEWEPLP